MPGDVFGALPFFEFRFFFAATEGKLKMVRKIEVAREKYMDGEGDGRENVTIKSQMANDTDVQYIFH
jgi:hypothetical protein